MYEMNNSIPLDPASLCVDTRAALDFGARGLVAKELIESLSHHLFEQDGPLVLAHPQQELNSGFRRTNTRKPAQVSWLSPQWESKFLAARQVGWFHRFLPVDKVKHVSCASITTLLPPTKKLPFYLSRKNGHQFVVPSQADADRIERLYSIPSSQITVIRPTIRRAIAQWPSFHFAGERGILIVREGRKDGWDRHESVVRKTFPNTAITTLDLRDAKAVAPQRWVRTLQSTSLCFYLVQRPFDWSTLALEAMYWNIPTVYADANPTLYEQIPHARLKLHTFMADPPPMAQLQEQANAARNALEASGILEPELQALAYKELYFKLGALGLG